MSKSIKHQRGRAIQTSSGATSQDDEPMKVSSEQCRVAISQNIKKRKPKSEIVASSSLGISLQPANCDNAVNRDSQMLQILSTGSATTGMNLKSVAANAFLAHQRLRTASILRKAKSHRSHINLRARRVINASPKRKRVVSLRQPNMEKLEGTLCLLTEPVTVTEEDRDLFERARTSARQGTSCCQKTAFGSSMSSVTNHSVRNPKAIRIGNFEIETWYSAPYPAEYAHLDILHLCEYCMKYMKSAEMKRRHSERCKLRHPPGDEIYRDGNISVFEVDGYVSRIYCQNICLLAKLFLDHKTLYYDVEPFLFYVVTKNDDYGFHFVGYFSKEKYSAQKYNLSCIMTLPCYQRQGFGRFLIDFSFLLSRREHLTGTPERPLSELGQLSYRNYWESAICEYLYNTVDPEKTKRITIKGIARGTGISVFDIVDTLRQLNFISRVDSRLLIKLNMGMLEDRWTKAKSNEKRIWIDESKLQWSLLARSPSKEFGQRSLHTMSSPFAAPIRHKLTRNRVEYGSFHCFRQPNEIILDSPSVSKAINMKVTVDSVQGKSREEKKSMQKKISEKKLIEESSDDNEQNKTMNISKNTCKDERHKKRMWRKTSGDDDSNDDFLNGRKRVKKMLPQALTKRITRKNANSRRFGNSQSKKSLALDPEIYSDSSRGESSDESEHNHHVAKNNAAKNTRHTKKRMLRSPRKRKRELIDIQKENDTDAVKAVCSASPCPSSIIDAVLSNKNDHKNNNVQSPESNESGSKSITAAKINNGIKQKRQSLHRIYSSSDLSGSDCSSDDLTLRQKMNLHNSKKLKQNILKESPHEFKSQSSIMNTGCNADHIFDSDVFNPQEAYNQATEKTFETDENDEMPPMLEADGFAKSTSIDYASDNDNNVIEVNASCTTEIADPSFGCAVYHAEMPLLRVNVAGNESTYEGEDEDAPPCLSPNFALDERSGTSSPKEHEHVPELSIASCLLKDNDLTENSFSTPSANLVETIAFVASNSTARIASTSNNICEMVNLGGDAGSEGEISEAEQKEHGVLHSELEKSIKTSVMSLKPEASVLDRPPKAPAMLSVPNDDHDLSHLTNNDEKMSSSSLAKENGQRINKEDVCVQQPPTVVHSPVTAISISGDLQSQNFISPPCSIQKLNTPDVNKSANSHSQLETTSPNSDTFMNSTERNDVHSNPSTPHINSHAPLQATGPEMAFESTASEEMRINMLVGDHVMSSTSKNLNKSSGSTASSTTSHQSQRRSVKKDQNRSHKSSTNNSRAQMVAPTTISQYVLSAPSTGPTISHHLSAQAAHSQTGHSSLAVSYYPANYAHARHAPYFETQFHPSSLSAISYPAAYVNYPTSIGGIGKAHSVGAGVPSGFTYSYPRGIPQHGANMTLPNGSGTMSHVTPQQMLSMQCPEIQNHHSAPSTWRYPNTSATFPGNFIDAFGTGMNPASNGGQFTLQNQLYNQQYNPYLMPMMRND